MCSTAIEGCFAWPPDTADRRTGRDISPLRLTMGVCPRGGNGKIRAALFIDPGERGGVRRCKKSTVANMLVVSARFKA